MHEAIRIDTRHAAWLFAITFLIYLSTAAGVLEYYDDWSMLQVTSSIVDHGGIDVPVETPGSTPGRDGRHYSKYGLGQSLLAVPFYIAGVTLAALTGIPITDATGAFRQATPLTYLLTLLGIVATALSVSLFFLLTRALAFDRRAAGIAALALGLATFAWYWALTFMTEPTSMLMLLLAFYAHVRDSVRPSAGWLALAGTALACTLLLRVASVVVLPGFGLWLLWEISRTAGDLSSAARRLAAWAFPVMSGMVAVALYNFARFGSVADIGYGAPSEHLQGSTWVGLYGIFFSPGRSMFLYAPILVAAAVGWVSLWRTRRSIAIAIGLVVVPYFLLHARLPYWHGGGCWSPRYVATILPFLMLGLAALVDRGLSVIGWYALALAGIASMGVQIVAVTVSCIPYASKMYATPASTDQLFWHAAYSPLKEHLRSAFVQDQPLHIAAVFFQSTSLAWLQATALIGGLLLLLLYLRSLFRLTPVSAFSAPQGPLTEKAADVTVRMCHPVAHRDELARGEAPEIEVSIVMPCLNEADTLETCIAKARHALDGHQIDGEIIVADNGSTDGSVAIANRMGARVVHVQRRGYGSALMAGVASARGKYIIMGDADDSYDFREVPRFVEALRRGYDLVQGCRLPSGGGRVLPGAMPLLHRWWGNPMFSLMARRWFKAPVHDVYCGLRGFTKTLYDELDQRCTGMEFATEMIIKSSLRRARIGEVPITLHPDGRTTHAPHLRTFRDGWRTLRFFLLYSPRWLYLVPGLSLTFLGLVGYALAMPGVTIRSVTFDAHTLLFASLAIICGYQSIVFAIFAKTFAVSEGLMPDDPRLDRFFSVINLERGLILGCGSLLIGLILLAGAVNQWRLSDFGRLEYRETMRWVIPGATLTALGFETILSSFFVSVLGLRRR